MAARWRGKDRDLNAGNSDFLTRNTLNEVMLSRGSMAGAERDVQSVMDRSILAILEDSTVTPEDKRRVEEESETTLLSALSEILDTVEDDDVTLSPFDTLLDAELLAHQEHRDNSPLRRLLSLAGAAPDRDPVCCSPKSSSLSPSQEKEESIVDRLRRPRFKEQSGGEETDRSKGESDSLPQGFKLPIQKALDSTNSFELRSKKAETEIEVFTPTSLVNLVNIMHPYCLRLHLEEEGKGWVSKSRQMTSPRGKQKKDHTLSSMGEIWKYEKPTGDSDEEINVDEDDEEIPFKETKEQEEGAKRPVDPKLLKSSLLNRDSTRAQPSREKKRVSFGPVQVACFNEAMEEESNGKKLTDTAVSAPLTSTKNPETLLGPEPEPLTKPSSENNCDTDEAVHVLPPQGETKAKSLSLQQYRQLRQKRLPLVEKQRNYTTKWPSLSETPKELTPILCLQGQKRHRCETKPCTNEHHSGLKHPRTESRINSPASPLPGITATLNVPENRSPVKKRTLLSSDPPNPVLLPLPVTQPSSDRAVLPSATQSSSEPKVAFLNRDPNLESTRLLQEIQTKFSTHPPKRESSSQEPKSKVLLLNQDPNLDSATLLQEIKNTFSKQPPNEERLSSRSPKHCPATAQPDSISDCQKPQTQHCSQSLKKETELLPKIAQLPSADLMRQTKCPSSMPYSTPPPTPVKASIQPEEKLTGVPVYISPSEEKLSPPQFTCGVQSSTCDSGIEAPDLTSLLEQFEETQVKDQNKCESDLLIGSEDISEAADPTRPPLETSCSGNTVEMLGFLDACLPSIEQPLCSSEPDTVITAELVNAPWSPHLQMLRDLDPDTVGQQKAHGGFGAPSVEPLERQSQQSFSTLEMPRTTETLRILPPVQMLETSDIPEPLGTDIVLSSQDCSSANQQRKLFPLDPQRQQPARSKTLPSKAIQIIDPRPLPSKRTHASPSKCPATNTSSQMHLSLASDHDYCAPVDRLFTSATLCSKTLTSTPNNFADLTYKSQATTCESSATSESKKYTSTCEANATFKPGNNSKKCVWQRLSEDERTQSETNLAIDVDPPFSNNVLPKQEYDLLGDSREDGTKPCTLPTPPPSPPGRGRVRRRCRKRSPDSDSSSSSPSSSSSSSSRSTSRSPQRKRLRHKRSESSSSSTSPSPSRSVSHSPPCRRYRLSYSRSKSRSRSWSQSRSRSRSPEVCRRSWGNVYSSRESRWHKRQHEIRIQKLKAIDERRVVYVGRIRRSMTHDELRERFSLFGDVECVSLHFRDRGDNYGFVTFYNMEDAFAAIENGSKLRRPDELPFDICFGGETTVLQVRLC
uniref:Peroxisome proliferator-activated receptor gamma coactivator-related protein 1-like n=1 Tax=Myripristis murdjan TaxID=586833 RepID=A0A667WVF5_9TELE